VSTGFGGTLKDGSGCLTEAGIAAFREARPGKAPPELAVHVAGCGRCQERLLAADTPPRPARGASPRPVAPSLGRTLLLAALLLATMLYFLYTLNRLTGP
jgi:hypothetical protein